MDADSTLTTTGKGNTKGKGSSGNDGASYAGQGGTQSENPRQVTYGSFNQTPNTQRYHKSQMGSGNNVFNNKTLRGGGVIVIKAKTAILHGNIQADGSPSHTAEVKKNYHAGSGGYIYIYCYQTSGCSIFNNVKANGGYGSDDQKSNGGSGGRIVFNNVNIKPEGYAVHGGCSNVIYSSNYNGAAGTVYFVDKRRLIITHTNKCLTSMRTIIDPKEIKDVDILYVLNQATLAFSNKGIIKNKMNVELEFLIITNSSFSNSILENGKNLGQMDVVVKHNLMVSNSKFNNIAVDFRIQARHLNISHTSVIKYHNTISLNITHTFNISGLITPNEQMMFRKNPKQTLKDNTSESTVLIYAGNVTINDPTILIKRKSPEFIFEKGSTVSGTSIMLFTDKNITMKGIFENVMMDQEEEQHIIGS